MAKTPEELTKDYKDAMQAYAGGSSAKQKKVMEIMNSALNLGAGFMDLGISGRQISEGERLRGELRDPGVFNPTRDTSLLRGRIADAQRRTGDVREDLAPAELANLDAYLADIGNARISSGGQASVFGAQGNAAALRRRRGGLDIAALGSQIKRQNRGELNQLVGMDLADRSAYENRKLSANEIAIQKYQTEAQEAGALEAAGRSNRRDSIYNILPSISEGIGQMGQMDFSGIGDFFEKRRMKKAVRKNVPVLNFNDADSPGEMMNTIGSGLWNV